MDKTVRRIEQITNVAVIVAFFIFAGVLGARLYQGRHPAGPSVGDVLPALSGYSWQSSSRTIILVLRKGCHFCDDSMPFYRKLYQQTQTGHISAKMVAVFPDSADDVGEVLRTQSLPIAAISRVSPATVKVVGTPTLILVDKNRRVEQAWVGQQNSAGENSILKELGGR